ncbi:MAG TPA: MBL fold metallo-hydrolase [Candidatus Binatus sp.]|nr:MBL fold metallo-hydrolase [Candidatus Binatus sp.]
MRKTTVLTFVFLVLVCAVRAQETSTDSLLFTIKPLGNNVFAAVAKPKSSAGSNAGFVIGDDGVAVIDTFQDAAAARQLLAEIQKLTKLPVKFVVNTHYHLDHVTGNAVFAQTGAVIIAHKNVRSWIHTENLKFFGAGIKPEQKAWIDGLLAPSLVYDSALELFLGSRRVVVRYFPGHTGGDSVVSVPDANVYFCGDLFWNKTLPNLIDASTEKWIASDLKMAGEGPKATFVPGHGEVGTAAEVRAMAGYITDLREALSQPVKDGLKDDALVNAVVPQLKEKYGDWNYFDHFAKPNILDTAKELRGEKQIPKAAE